MIQRFRHTRLFKHIAARMAFVFVLNAFFQGISYADLAGSPNATLATNALTDDIDKERDLERFLADLASFFLDTYPGAHEVQDAALQAWVAGNKEKPGKAIIESAARTKDGFTFVVAGEDGPREFHVAVSEFSLPEGGQPIAAQASKEELRARYARNLDADLRRLETYLPLLNLGQEEADRLEAFLTAWQDREAPAVSENEYTWITQDLLERRLFSARFTTSQLEAFLPYGEWRDFGDIAVSSEVTGLAQRAGAIPFGELERLRRSYIENSAATAEQLEDYNSPLAERLFNLYAGNIGDARLRGILNRFCNGQTLGYEDLHHIQDTPLPTYAHHMAEQHYLVVCDQFRRVWQIARNHRLRYGESPNMTQTAGEITEISQRYKQPGGGLARWFDAVNLMPEDLGLSTPATRFRVRMEELRGAVAGFFEERGIAGADRSNPDNWPSVRDLAELRNIDDIMPVFMRGAGNAQIRARRLLAWIRDNNVDPQNERISIRPYRREDTQFPGSADSGLFPDMPSRNDLSALWREDVRIEDVLSSELFGKKGMLGRLEKLGEAGYLGMLKTLLEQNPDALVADVLEGRYGVDVEKALHQVADEFLRYAHKTGRAAPLKENDPQIQEAIRFFWKILGREDVADEIIDLVRKGKIHALRERGIPIRGHASERYGINIVIGRDTEEDETAALIHEIGVMLGLEHKLNKKLETAYRDYKDPHVPLDMKLAELQEELGKKIVTAQGRVVRIDTAKKLGKPEVERIDVAAAGGTPVEIATQENKNLMIRVLTVLNDHLWMREGYISAPLDPTFPGELRVINWNNKSRFHFDPDPETGELVHVNPDYIFSLNEQGFYEAALELTRIIDERETEGVLIGLSHRESQILEDWERLVKKSALRERIIRAERPPLVKPITVPGGFNQASSQMSRPAVEARTRPGAKGLDKLKDATFEEAAAAQGQEEREPAKKETTSRRGFHRKVIGAVVGGTVLATIPGDNRQEPMEEKKGESREEKKSAPEEPGEAIWAFEYHGVRQDAPLLMAQLRATEGVPKRMLVLEVGAVGLGDIGRWFPESVNFLTFEGVLELIALMEKHNNDEEWFRNWARTRDEPLKILGNVFLQANDGFNRAMEEKARKNPLELLHLKIEAGETFYGPIRDYLAAHPDVEVVFEQPPLISLLYGAAASFYEQRALESLYLEGDEAGYTGALLGMVECQKKEYEGRETSFGEGQLPALLAEAKKGRQRTGVVIQMGIGHEGAEERVGDYKGFRHRKKIGTKILDPWMVFFDGNRGGISRATTREDFKALLGRGRRELLTFVAFGALQEILVKGGRLSTKEAYQQTYSVVNGLSPQDVNDLTEFLQATAKKLAGTGVSYEEWKALLSTYALAWLNEKKITGEVRSLMHKSSQKLRTADVDEALQPLYLRGKGASFDVGSIEAAKLLTAAPAVAVPTLETPFPSVLPGSPASMLEEAIEKAEYRYKTAEELASDLDIAASTAERDLKLLADGGLLRRRKNEESGKYEYKVSGPEKLQRDRLDIARRFLDELFDTHRPQSRGNVTKFRSGEGRRYLIAALQDIVRLTSGGVRRVSDDRGLKAYYVVEDSLFALLTEKADVDALEIPDARQFPASTNRQFINFVIRFAEENNMPELREIAELLKRGNVVFLKASSISDPAILKPGKRKLLSYQLGSRTQRQFAKETMWHERAHLELIALERSEPDIWKEIVERLGQSRSKVITELRAKVEGVYGYVEASTKNAHELLSHFLTVPRYSGEAESTLRRVLPAHLAEPILQIQNRTQPSAEAIGQVMTQAEEITTQLEPRDYAGMVKQAMGIAVRPAKERWERPAPDIPESSPAGILRFVFRRASEEHFRSISYLTPEGISEDVAKRHLILLWKAGLLEREGQGDAAMYRVAEGLPQERLKAAQACLDWFFNRAGPVGKGALTAYRSGEGRDRLITILKDIVEPSGLIRKVSEEGQEDTYVVADTLYSLFSYGVPQEQVGIAVRESSVPSYEFTERVTLCVIAAAAEHGYPGAGELMGLVARGGAIFFRASRISDPERYMPHIGASADSPILDRDREDYVKSKLWHERIHLATDRFDTVMWKRIADAIDKTENAFVSNLSTLLSARGIYVKGSVLHTKETLAYALTEYRNPAANRRIIKETFPKDLAEIILDIWNRTRPSQADANRLVRAAERLGEYAEQTPYIEPTVKEMAKADAEVEEARRVALHNRPTGPRSLDRFLEDHADSIYQLQRDNEKAKRHRVGGKITKLRQALEETVDACGVRDILEELESLVAEGQRKRVRLQVCVIDDDEELPGFLEEGGEEAIVVGGHASTRNVTVIARKRDLDDIPGLVARFFHEIRARSSLARERFEQADFGTDLEEARAVAKKLRTDFEKENKDLEEMIREYVIDRQGGRDIERKTQNIRRRKLVREFAGLKFDKGLSPLGRDLTATGETLFDRFLRDRGMFAFTPLDFYGPGADVFEPDREMRERYKQLATSVRQFINGLPSARRNEVFEEKLVAAGIDRYLSAMAGKTEVPFTESRGKVVAAEDYTQTITFRLPQRNFRIPHCAYRISVEFPDGPRTFFIKAVNHGQRNNLIYQECASLLGFDMYPRQMRYFPRDSKSEWLIYEEIPEATLVEELPPGKLQEDEEWFIGAISRSAALNHALLVRGTGYLFTQPERAPPSLNSLDHEFMLIEENFRELLTYAYMGDSEVFLLQQFPAFGDLEQRVDLLERFERAYFSAYMDIINNRDRLKAVISAHDKKRAAVFERSLREHFVMRFEQMVSALLEWPVKERHLEAWNRVLEQKSIIEINSALANYPNAALPEAQKALSILTSEVYGTRRKAMELSREREVLNESYRLIQWAAREMLGEPDSAALEKDVKALEEEKEQCLQMATSRREAWIEPQLEAAASIEEVEFLLRAVGQRLSAWLLERFIDKLVSLSTVEGNLDVGLLVENVTRARNVASPPVHKRLRQSKRLTKLIFGIETVATPMVNFDRKTLVLRETLGRYVKDDHRVLEIGPGSNATLSNYLARHKRNLRILAAEINPQFVESARQAVELNGFGETIQVVESDIVSNVEDEHDVAFWNIPFVTASARRLEEMRPGLYDFMLEYATEEDEGHNLIRRFLAEAPAKVAADGTLIFASNTSYVPEKEIRRLIAESGLKLIRTVRLPHNPAVAFVLKFRKVKESDVASIYKDDALVARDVLSDEHVKADNRRFVISLGRAVTDQERQAIEAQAEAVERARGIKIEIREPEEDVGATYVFECWDKFEAEDRFVGRARLNLRRSRHSLDRTLGILDFGLAASAVPEELNSKNIKDYERLLECLNRQYRLLDTFGRDLLDADASPEEIVRVLHEDPIDIILPPVNRQDFEREMEFQMQLQALEEFA